MSLPDGIIIYQTPTKDSVGDKDTPDLKIHTFNEAVLQITNIDFNKKTRLPDIDDEEIASTTAHFTTKDEIFLAYAIKKNPADRSSQY